VIRSNAAFLIDSDVEEASKLSEIRAEAVGSFQGYRVTELVYWLDSTTMTSDLTYDIDAHTFLGNWKRWSTGVVMRCNENILN